MAIMAVLERIEAQSASGLLPSLHDYEFSQLPQFEAYEGNTIPTILQTFLDKIPAQPDLLMQAEVLEFKTEIADRIAAQEQAVQAEDLSLPKNEASPEVAATDKAEPFTQQGDTNLTEFNDTGIVPELVTGTKPSVAMGDEGRVEVESGPLDIFIPDTTIDPRGEGTYESENVIVQQIFDAAIKPLHDSVPSPINSLGTDIYNSVIGYDKDAGEQ